MANKIDYEKDLSTLVAAISRAINSMGRKVELADEAVDIIEAFERDACGCVCDSSHTCEGCEARAWLTEMEKINGK